MVISSVMFGMFLRVGLVAVTPIIKALNPQLAETIQPLLDIYGKGLDIVFGEQAEAYCQRVRGAIDQHIEAKGLNKSEANLVRRHLNDIFTDYIVHHEVNPSQLANDNFEPQVIIQNIKNFANSNQDFREFRNTHSRLASIALELIDIQYQTITNLPEFQNEISAKFRSTVAENFKKLQDDMKEWHPTRQALQKLKLPFPQRHSDRIKSPTNVLRAADRLVPFMGHQNLLAELLIWANREDHHSPNDGPVRIYVGPGGTGKSRIMIEVCQRMRLEGGQAGFLSPEDATITNVNLIVSTFKPILYAQPVLIVIDDVERFPISLLNQIVKLLTEARNSGNGQPINIVLLSRNADVKEGWLRDLKDSIGQGPNQPGIVATPQYLGLPEGISRQQIYDASIRAFGTALAGQFGSLTHPWRVPTRLSDPHDSAFDRVLYIQLAALAEVTGRDPNTFQSGTDLLSFAYQRERQYLHEMLDLHDPLKGDAQVREAAHIVITAFALGATITNHRELERALESLLPRYGDKITRLRRVLQSTYPPLIGSNRALAPLQPDLLAEQWIYEMTR